jgi:IMP dehydrogenase
MSRELFRGRTFDDFLFRPRLGRVGSRTDARLTSAFSKGIALELPVVSANMDSVTGAAMARTMALEGGIGIVHRALSIEDQAREVERVKRSHGGVVEDPIRLPRTATMREARETIKSRGVTGLLIEETRGSGTLAGILSKRDMPWEPGRDGDPVERHMTPFDRLHLGRPGMSPDEAARVLYEHRIEKLPVVDGERRILGLITKSDIILTRERPDSTKDAKGHLRVGAAVGARGDYLDRAEALLAAGADALVVDIAHGHSEVMAEALRALRSAFPRRSWWPETSAPRMERSSSRIWAPPRSKVGIGPGRGCRTRLETAAGVPQLEAIYEVRLALGDSIPIIADGGMRDDKDVVLALLCGASSVMLGSMLSGTDEAPGRVIEDPATHEKRKVYRGMTSPQAVLATHYGAGDEEEIERALDIPAEGQEVEVPYRGSVRDVLHRLRGHLKSAVSYSGETSLGAARQILLERPEAFLIPLSAASRRESYER